jgi:hypothetical protein
VGVRDWQALYAAHGIPTFPVHIGPDGKKTPLVKHYAKFGLRGSSEIAEKFAEATGIGFMAGRRSRLSILDVDSSDEGVLARALDRHGRTPVVVRSGSGNWQAWYRHNGEPRLIRPFGDKPVDVLGAGVVVAPPSQGTKATYQFVEGGLDDLDCLPVMLGVAELHATTSGADQQGSGQPVTKGNRNRQLFRYCLKHARHCDDLDALLDVARTYNESFLPPLPDDEVMGIAKSAWGYEERGENIVGHHGVYMSTEEVNELLQSDPDRLLLKVVLKANNSPSSKFMIANGMHAKFRWGLKRFVRARHRMERSGEIDQIRPASQRTGPALYRWKNHRRQK